MMRLIPFEKYTIQSNLSIDQLHEVIDKACSPWKPKSIFASSKEKTLFGERNGNEFKMYHRTWYGGSYIPTATGVITELDAGCLIEVTLEANIALRIFMGALLIIASVTTLRLITSNSSQSLLFPAMAVFSYLITRLGFWLEAPKLKHLISQLTCESHYRC